MPLDETNNGGLLGDDSSGSSHHEPGRELEAEVQRQVNELARLRYEPWRRHEMLRLMQHRRRLPKEGEPAAQQSDRPAHSPRRHHITQFDFLPVEEGFDTLFVRGELLITGESYDGRHPRGARQGQGRCAKEYLDALDMEASDVPCHELRDRVLRLTPSAKRGSQERRMGPHELADLAKVLRSQGHNVAPHYVMASAGVQKPPPAPIPAPAPTGAVQLTAAAGARSPDRRKPVKVAIIDTGITDEIRTDNFLTTVPREERDIDRLDVFPLPSGDTYLDFAAGHGTFVAGIVQQVAPRADIVVYRAIDSDGIASDVAVACEMIRAVKEGAQIVNLSLSCQTQDNMPPIATQAALEIIREMGKEVLIVAAAGNYADTAPSWPAAFCEVVSVAGLAPDMQPSQWSSRGFWVTFSTIGQGLHSTYVVGQESALVDPDRRTFGKNAWAYWSGTSFAAPQITGRLADRYQHEDISLREALAKLLAEGQAVPDFGRALRILPGI